MNQSQDEFDQYGRQKELWINSHMISLDVPLIREKAQKILPLGMRLTENPTGTLFIVDYLQPNFTVPYRESALLIHVKTLFGRGLHCAWMTVDDDTALIYGRELLGYPKKMAMIDLEEVDDEFNAAVQRRDVSVLTMKGKKGCAQTNPKPVFDIKMFNVGGIGSATVLQAIWLSRSKERIIESYDADIEVMLKPSRSDPISNLVESSSGANGRIAMFDIVKGRYLLPVGLAGPLWYQRTSMLRTR